MPRQARLEAAPALVHSHAELVREVDRCRRCPLYRDATQGVAGEGAHPAPLMLVGEQPGDAEDRAGRPFVGPAGRMLDQALEAAGIGRDEVYITNAVKHFKFAAQGKRRLHKRPNRSEVEVCRWWLDLELDLVQPRLVVALGATAALSLLRRPVTIAAVRGRVLEVPPDRCGIVTVHPSYLLRIRDEEDKVAQYRAFVRDLRLAAREARNRAAA